VWACTHKLPNVLASFLTDITADARTADLLVQTPMGPEGSLLQWIYEHLPSKGQQKALDKMVPSLRHHLAKTPLDQWTTDQA
jgi:hypothetical protein